MMRQDNIGARSRAAAIEEIGKVSFCIDELRLYLDTHPHCEEAYAMIKEYMAKRKELIRSFEEKFGSIKGYHINDSDDSWLWNAGYMPWENGEGGFC